MDFEKKLNRLESLVTAMETGEMSLEDSLKSFEEGVKLARECHEQLNAAEQKVKMLVKIDENGVMETENFNAEEN